MGTAVERLEIWTASLLLAVAVVVGIAGTLASTATTPAPTKRMGSPPSTAPGETFARSASTIAQLPGRLMVQARNAATPVVQAVERLPAGIFGGVAALLAGSFGVPLLIAAARRARMAAGAIGRRTARLLTQGSLVALRARARRPKRATTPSLSAPPAVPQPAVAVIAPTRYDTPPVAEEPASSGAPIENTAPQPMDDGARRAAEALLRRREQGPVQPVSAVGPGRERRKQEALEPAASTGPDMAALAARAGEFAVTAKGEPGRSDEDLAFAAMREAAAITAASGVDSPVLAVDIANDAALVLLDLRPGEQARLDAAFAAQTLARSHSSLRWRPPSIHVQFEGKPAGPAATTALAVPLLRMGRRRVRYIPFRTWRHLGVYGAGAHAAAHHIISALLCQQRPDDLGLAVLDRQGWASLYRNTPHWVETPGDGPATADALSQALRRGTAHALRSLLFVVVDPDGATLSAFASLLSRLSLQPAVPLHILLVQRTLQTHGRRLYLSLPALVTAGSAMPELLPAVRHWPRSGEAAALVRNQRWVGRPFVSDEAEVGELTRRLARYPRSRVPVLWHTAEGKLEQSATADPTGA